MSEKFHVHSRRYFCIRSAWGCVDVHGPCRSFLAGHPQLDPCTVTVTNFASRLPACFICMGIKPLTSLGLPVAHGPSIMQTSSPFLCLLMRTSPSFSSQRSLSPRSVMLFFCLPCPRIWSGVYQSSRVERLTLIIGRCGRRSMMSMRFSRNGSRVLCLAVVQSCSTSHVAIEKAWLAVEQSCSTPRNTEEETCLEFAVGFMSRSCPVRPCCVYCAPGPLADFWLQMAESAVEPEVFQILKACQETCWRSNITATRHVILISYFFSTTGASFHRI